MDEDIFQINQSCSPRNDGNKSLQNSINQVGLKSRLKNIFYEFQIQQLKEQQLTILETLNYIQTLENKLSLNQKEQENVKQMNDFYLQGMKKNESLYENSIKQVVELKKKIEDQDLKMKKLENKYSQDNLISLRLNKLLDDSGKEDTLKSPNKQVQQNQIKQNENVRRSTFLQESDQDDIFKSQFNIENLSQQQEQIENQSSNQNITPNSNLQNNQVIRQTSQQKSQSFQNLPLLKKQIQNNKPSFSINKQISSKIIPQTTANNNQFNSLQEASTKDESQNPNSIQNQTVQRFNFLQHSTDFQFFSTLLDMSLDDQILLREWEQNKFNQTLKELSQGEAQLKKYLSKLDKDSFIQLYDSLSQINRCQEIFFNLILKLKKVIHSVSVMHSSLLLNDAFVTIVEQTCSILKCDRASVFLVDRKKNELWTKVAKGTTTIRIPNGKGFVGHVATKGEMVNVLDAHKDQRFNKEIDIKNNYRTKTVLAVPIYEQDSTHIIGVLQAINKFEGFFTKDDEGIINILSRLVQVVLRNSIYHDEKQAFHNQLRLLLKIGVILNSQKTVQDLLISAEENLIKNFDTPYARIYVFDDKKQKLIRFDEQKNLIEVEPHIGISGLVYNLGMPQYILNNYTHPNFNNISDIPTQMPVFCLPLYAQVDHLKIKMGVIQVVNSKGLEDLLQFSQANVQSNTNTPKTFQETLENYGLIFCQSLLNLFKINKEQINQINVKQVMFD